MSRGLLIALVALAVSVALNIFGAATWTTAAIGRDRVESRAEAQARPGRTSSTMTLISRLDPAVQSRVRDTLRAAAMEAKPDFELARERRREAVRLAALPEFDAAEVTALLDQSRAAEIRGRERLEATAVPLLASLSPADRAIMAEILSRRHGGRVKGKEGAAPAQPARPPLAARPPPPVARPAVRGAGSAGQS